ncbi:MAG: GNAT family N-acetyltransferase [Verrucomicrobia bacterium]|nr:GNAT family N-acetyltransferase [Verrucomicrobiota bacterium]MBV8483135.1 GNAT family N-acetyltransferase [Verrucomicrobiota bacterium]
MAAATSPNQSAHDLLFKVRAQGLLRFSLRPLSAGDLRELARIRALEQVATFLPGGRLDPSQAARRVEWIAAESTRDWLTWGIGLTAIVEDLSGQLIGYCGLNWIDSASKFQICYMLSPSFWGRGIATTSVGAVIDHARMHRICDEIIGLVPIDNVRSKKVLLRHGFAHRKNIKDGPTEIEYLVRVLQFDSA